MLFGVQLTFCLLFTLIVCFFVGKRIGERKFKKLREEMKAYEMSFNQLIEQMEMVSSHNLKVLQTRTDELRDLIPVIDKKLLYANDLMQEVETLKKESGTRLGAIKSEPVMDLKLRRDVQELVADLQNRLKTLEIRLGEFEKNEREQESLLKSLVAAKKGEERAVPLKLEKVHDLPEPVFQTNVELSTFSPKIGNDRQKLLKPHALLENPAVDESRPIKPKPGTVLHEVLTLHERGVTLPQIARQLKMDHGEVEVIMNLYGSRGSLRKVT